MNLTAKEQGWLDDVGHGIAAAEAFMAVLTDHHGDAVTTEYLLTADIARALLTRSQPDLAIEYLVNRIENHVLTRDSAKPFALGSRRFDVAVLDEVAPVFAIEVKIRVGSLHPELAKDLDKIVAHLDCLTPGYAQGLLGASVFQVHVAAEKQQVVPGTTARVQAIEARVRAELQAFAAAKADHEFAWAEFQPPGGRIHNDEITADTDGDSTPMLGRPGYACRFHAILVRRLCGRPGNGAIPVLAVH